MSHTEGPGRPESLHDRRGRKIALLCHCLLNANSKVEGLAQYAGVHPLVTRLAEAGVGVVQMPCAEMGMCGMRRWGQTREQYGYPAFIAHCDRLAADAESTVDEYLRCGYEVLGVVGVDGSPTCGVSRSASGDWGGEPSPEDMVTMLGSATSSSVPGVHIEALQARLSARGITFTAIDESVSGHNVDGVMNDLLGDVGSA